MEVNRTWAGSAFHSKQIVSDYYNVILLYIYIVSEIHNNGLVDYLR